MSNTTTERRRTAEYAERIRLRCQDALITRLASYGATLRGPYEHNEKPVLIECRDGHVFSRRPDTIRAGRGICRSCVSAPFDAFYVVSGAQGVKFGVTSGDPERRLRNHARDGYGRIDLLRVGLPEGVPRRLESDLIEVLPMLGAAPVRGREYYGPEVLSTVLQFVNSWLAETLD